MPANPSMKPGLEQSLRLNAVEPEEASVMFSGSDVRVEEHQIPGIGDGFMPKIVEMRRLKRVYTIGSKEAVDMARSLCRKHGLMVGISSGANMLVEQGVAKK